MFRSIPILILLAAHASAATAYLDPKQLGEAFGYPAEKITATDWTETAKKKTPNVISSFLYEGERRTFARVAVVIADYKSLLTDDYESEIHQSIAKTKSDNLPPAIIRIDLGENGYAYTGLGAFGPGGSQNALLGSLPDAKIDFRVSVTIPAEPPLARMPGAESYYELIDGSQLDQKILEISHVVVRNYTKGNVIEIPAAGNPAKLETPQRIPLEGPSEATQVPAPEKFTPSSSLPNSRPFLLWVLSLAGIGIVGALAFLTRKKNSSK